VTVARQEVEVPTATDDGTQVIDVLVDALTTTNEALPELTWLLESPS
jgi:hypothetical protein